MVVYIADEPSEYTLESQEDKIFYALKNNLPQDEDYYVFHSYRITNVINNVVIPKEIDFVIFNPKRGIICIEAKAGKISTQYNSKNKLSWYYGNGIEIKNGGPYRQAENKKIALINRFKKAKCSSLLDVCKIHYAVWFVSLTKDDIKNIVFTADAAKELTLTRDDLEHPVDALNAIYNLDVEKDMVTRITEHDKKRILENVLCPEFNLVPSMTSELSIKKTSLMHLLKEQIKILDFLDDQQVVTINGAGGTGKTMIALEKARRSANNGDKVLFLCYNRALCEWLRDKQKHINIDFYNIDYFACFYCKTQFADYKLLKEKITNDYFNGDFPYQHVIIDEGQDFGQIEIENNNILDTLEAAVVNEQDGTGSMYLFYDKQQFIQGANYPKYIQNANCRLSLTTNCRNTKNIAETSFRLLESSNKHRKILNSIDGDDTVIYISKDKSKQLEYLNTAILASLNNGINPDEIVILSCKTKEDIKNGSSLLSDYNNTYNTANGEFKISNCTDFKGLEADAIILIDIDKNLFFSQKSCNRFYVGASRAKLNLHIICDMKQEDCIVCEEKLKQIQEENNNITEKNIPNNTKHKSIEKHFAAALNAMWYK